MYTQITYTAEELIMVGFLLISLAFTLIWCICNKFWLNKVYAIVLICWYAIFMLVIILVEVRIIPNFII